MSMLSMLIDRLRSHADLYDGKTEPPMDRELQRPYLAQELREAADTIWQLRDDLQRANDAAHDAEHDESMAWDRVRKAERENAKLRKLVRISIVYCNSGTCDECPIQGDDGRCPYAEMALELGVEVDE